MPVSSTAQSTTAAASGMASLASITPALTTTFKPEATTCTENRLTMLANRAYEIWMNEPIPVPGSTLSDCYPSQFMQSYTLLGAKVTQPAFNPLVCPENYETMGPFTSNYIACCPRYVVDSYIQDADSHSSVDINLQTRQPIHSRIGQHLEEHVTRQF